MSSTNLQERKLELIQWVSVIEDAKLIDKLTELKAAVSADWWDETGEEERASIAKGIIDADSGRLKSHAEAKMVYENWL